MVEHVVPSHLPECTCQRCSLSRLCTIYPVLDKSVDDPRLPFTGSLANVIMYLNDVAHWPRWRIAAWIDSLP